LAGRLSGRLFGNSSPGLEQLVAALSAAGRHSKASGVRPRSESED
jgi:hypothetical protein